MKNIRLMQNQQKTLLGSVLVLAFSLLFAGSTFAINTLNDYTSYPPFISTETPPNVIIALDISGSMKQSAYTQPGKSWRNDTQDDYNKNYKYFGYFDSTSKYSYDADKEFFVADPTGDWDGNFLNWAAMRRIDVTRKVIVGGKVSVKTLNQDSTSPTHNQVVPVNRNRAKKWTGWDIKIADGGDWDGYYILEGQHEPYDYQFYKQYSANATESLTPSTIPDGTTFLISEGKLQPQLGASNSSVIQLSDEVEIGRGSMDWDKDWDDEADNGLSHWLYIPFANNYIRPKVVVKSATYNGGDPMVEPRVRMDASGDGFHVRLEEWDYKDGSHTTEDFSYLIVESEDASGLARGCVTVKDSGGSDWQFCADYDDNVATTAGGVDLCGGAASQPLNIDFSGLTFSTDKPIYFTGISTWTAGAHTVTTRNEFYDNSSVNVRIQEEKSQSGDSSCSHPEAEEISAIAIVPPGGASTTIATGTFSYNGNTARVQLGITTGVDDGWKTISYDTADPFDEKPIFIADFQSLNGQDPSVIRVAGSNQKNDADGIEIKVHEEDSTNDGLGHTTEDVGWFAVEYSTGYKIRIGLTEEPIGLVQKVASSMRLGVAVYNFEHDDLHPTEIYRGNRLHGGTLNPCYPDSTLPPDQQDNYDICLSTGVQDPVINTIQVIEEHPLIWGSTPIAETLIEIKNYVQQNHNAGIGFYDDGSSEPTYPFGQSNDPYYYNDIADYLECANTFVLHFNDGEPYRDWDGDSSNHPVVTGDGVGATGLNEMLDDVAYSLRNVDLRTEADLPGHQEVISYYVLAALGEDDPLNDKTRVLREAAINGGFYDDDDDNTPDPKHPADVNNYISDNTTSGVADCSDKKNEWDRDGDCNPDTFYFANDGYALEQELADAFLDIALRNASGTAASVISNSRSGEGAVYQSVFYPEYDDKAGSTVAWSGQLHALLVDAYGNLREDTNQNAQLDLEDDYFIIFDGDTVLKYRDGYTQSDGSWGGANGILDDYEKASTVESGYADSIDYLWSSTDWLNNDSVFDATTQRAYDGLDDQRYIFTFIDDGDMLTESGEVVPFHTGDVSDVAAIAPYLHAFEPFAYTASSPPPGIDALDFTAFMGHQSVRLIDWIRGEDQGAKAFSSSLIPPMRSRKYDSGSKTWRLGDIVNSTPTVVGRPAENFDLLYNDRTYISYYAKYRHRRNVVYVGANDGMFHAFNGGFYDSMKKKYRTQPLLQPLQFNAVSGDYDEDPNVTNYDLGAEMWSYVPFNLLPHLYWLSDPDYTHVYYSDLKPKVFDANIFTPESACSDVFSSGCIHPNGWGTVLVAGMRFGGGEINPDLDKDGVLDAAEQAQTMTSAFFIFDITNPEAPPELLAEVTLPGMGYTTSYPMVIALRDRGLTGTEVSYNNDWYLFLGSGPADATGAPDDFALNHAVSAQPGKIFLLDLNKLGSGNSVCFMDTSGNCNDVTASPGPIVSLDTNTFISEAIGVDWDVDFKNDSVYFGTVNYDPTDGWGGKLRRLVVNDNPTINTTNWDFDNVFLDLSATSTATGQPIVAAPAAGLDKSGNRWLFFGTGRYYTPADSYNDDQQSYYGLKEPISSNTFTYATLNKANDLFDSSDVRVYDGGADVKDAGGSIDDFLTLKDAVKNKSGWFMDFPDLKERNLGQAALLGQILTFTTYVPGIDPCTASGESWVYVLNYETGTANEFSVIGTDPTDKTTSGDNVADKEKVLKRKKVGEGLATSPGLHTGRGRGAKAFIQSSTGAITTIEESTPGRTKSGMTSWQVE